MRLFVYGTLRTGGALSDILPHTDNVHICEVSGVCMYSLGPFPIIIESHEEERVVGELRDYTGVLSDLEWDLLLRELDYCENVKDGLYKRSNIDTPHGKAVVYIVNGTWWQHSNIVKPITDWAVIDDTVAKMVPTLVKENSDVEIRTKEQKK